MATASSSQPLYPPQLLQSSWQRPPVGWIKLNWDAAMDHQNGLMGVGLVARDSRGQVQVSLCHFMPYLTDPTVAEAFAARRDVELCSAMGFTAVIFEGDSQMIVKALLVDEAQPNSFDSIIADTRLLLSSFPQWQVRFVRRTDNDIAHRLAIMAVKHKVSHRHHFEMMCLTFHSAISVLWNRWFYKSLLPGISYTKKGALNGLVGFLIIW